MTLVIPGTVTIPVSVLVERRRGVTQWQEHVWRPTGVQVETHDLPPWTMLHDDGIRALFHAGVADVSLFPTDTLNYKHNLDAAAPRLWVILRTSDTAPGLALHAVTADAGEAHLYTDSGNDLVEALPLPPALQDRIAAFVAEHHVEREFHKRRRDRQDPESLARLGRDESLAHRPKDARRDDSDE